MGDYINVSFVKLERLDPHTLEGLPKRTTDSCRRYEERVCGSNRSVGNEGILH